jgi:serine phosphatase RsbU (regulator of sigma subunit)/anti-sigma regulatory factor (Ser/Thr protein kinase)
MARNGTGTRREYNWAPQMSGAEETDTAGPSEATVAVAETVENLAPEIAPGDPIVGYLQSATGAVDLTQLELDSPALRELRARGVVLVVPLITNGELVGVLNVGPRRSEQGYSADDKRLLESLAAHAAPAMRVGELIREQHAEMQERGRMEQELQVARMIQKNFLPKTLPVLPGWSIAADYRPARAVGGDFYDFVELDGGRIGLVIGDVTDKGIPAAMVMSATKSLLRASAQRLVDPGEVLARMNDQLCPEIPENMFVTCFYGVLEPTSGVLRYANAGHNLPLVHDANASAELRATGMPLGLMPEMGYEVKETTIAHGARMLLYSDGLVEAHGDGREMFGTARAAELLRDPGPAGDLIARTLAALDDFTGAGAGEREQEDDITLVALVREGASGVGEPGSNGRVEDAVAARMLADFTVSSAPGNERDALARVTDALAPVNLTTARLERLKTATAEATMNAMEHGNRNDPALEVRIVVAATEDEVTVRISDHGLGGARLAAPVQTPDIEAKLEGLESPRGWGLFLIEKMVDSVRHWREDSRHVVELAMRAEGDEDATGDP